MSDRDRPVTVENEPRETSERPDSKEKGGFFERPDVTGRGGPMAEGPLSEAPSHSDVTGPGWDGRLGHTGPLVPSSPERSDVTGTGRAGNARIMHDVPRDRAWKIIASE